MATDGMEAAQRHVEELELQLALRDYQLEQYRTTLDMIHRSDGWKLLQVLYRVRNTLLPPRLRAALRRAKSWLRRSAGRVLGRPAPVTHSEMEGLVNRVYPRWIARYEPGPAELEEQRRRVFSHAPTISLLTPTYNTPPGFLREMIESVRRQTYPHWQLCLADGGSTAPGVRELLREYADRDSRIRVRFLDDNRGIVGNTNAALELATGELIGLLDHDDTLAPFALYEMAAAAEANPDADFFYSDEDKLDPAGRRCEPFFKPDWSPETLLTCNYICHFTVLSRELLQRLGGFRTGFDGSQDHDLVLRATENARQVVHVPRVLYHWRQHELSTASRPAAKVYAYLSARRALLEHLKRRGIAARVSLRGALGQYRLDYVPPQSPAVSAVVVDRGEAGLCEQTLAALREAALQPVEVLVTAAQPEALNRAAAAAQGNVLLFVEGGLRPLAADWLGLLAVQALQPGIGAVGPKLCCADGTVRAGKLVLGLCGLIGSLYRGLPRGYAGYITGQQGTHNCSAVAPACLAVTRAAFRAAGGFDTGYRGPLAGVDLCLRLLAAGRRNVYLADAELVDGRPAGEGPPEDEAYFRTRWAERLAAGDPYHNPNLSREHCFPVPRA
jgi:glycosyltransferase involved in cell wall biosynthesis